MIQKEMSLQCLRITDSFCFRRHFPRSGFQGWSMALPVVSLESHSIREQHPKHEEATAPWVPRRAEGPRAWLEEAVPD